MKPRSINHHLILCAGVTFGLLQAVPVQAHGDGAAGMFEAMDANGDGKVSPEEHATAAKKMFDMMDGNADGKVTAAEMTAAHEQMGKHMGKPAAVKAATKADTRSADKELSASEKIKVIDTNGDGVLSAEEHAAGSKTMFAKMDTDHDGFLSKAEMTAGHATMLHKSAK